MRSARPQVVTGPAAPSRSREDRRDPAVRRRLSPAALRTFFAVARAWTLSAAEERALLGWPPSSTFHKYKSGQPGVLSYDTLTRISLVLGIYKALQVLYPEAAFADRWIGMPNSNPLFGGRTPLALMTETGVDGLFQVRRLLDARRG
jgi:Antitoxin Xre/MbcA/ParS C-terminal toxin-binding domain/Antitoxin Xre-like helix-turn-helix domain